MNYLATYYKNLSEQFENRISELQAIIESRRQYDKEISPYMISTRLPGGNINPHALHGSSRVVVGMAPMPIDQKSRLAKLLAHGSPERKTKTKEGEIKIIPATPPHEIVGPKPSKDPDELILDVGRKIERNLEWGHDRALQIPELEARSQQWYPGAERISSHLGKRFGVEPHVSGAVLAALSPQKDWYMNVSLGERLMGTPSDHDWSEEMERVTGKILKPDNKEHQAALKAIRGKKFKEIEDPMHAAVWARAYDEAHRPRRYRVVTPEGEFGDFAKTDKGKESHVAWGSYGQMANAIKAYRSKGDMETISQSAGTAHKVRNFYGNIVQPNNPNNPDVTVDTHAIGSGLLLPGLAGSNWQVGIGLGGRPKSTESGMGGTYPLFADAFRAVAKRRGMVPNALQSTVWDEKRASLGVGTPKAKAKKRAMAELQKRFRAGELSHDEVLRMASDIAGPVGVPTWAKTKTLPLDLRPSTFESYDIHKKIQDKIDLMEAGLKKAKKSGDQELLAKERAKAKHRIPRIEQEIKDEGTMMHRLANIYGWDDPRTRSAALRHESKHRSLSNVQDNLGEIEDEIKEMNPWMEMIPSIRKTKG